MSAREQEDNIQTKKNNRARDTSKQEMRAREQEKNIGRNM